MAYVTREARRELLDAVADAIGQIGVAVAALGDAYELLDEAGGDALESTLFRPVQTAYGRAQRTYSEFASRHGLLSRTFKPAPPAGASRTADELLESAIDAAGGADESLAELQDSMMPVEVGDPELRAGLAEVRRLLNEVPLASRELRRRLGR